MWRILLTMALTGLVAAACAGGRSDEEELAHRLEKFREATFTVTYEVAFERPDAPSETSRLVWYQQGKRTRVDWRGRGGSTAAIVREDRSYNCTERPTSSIPTGGCIVHPPYDVPLLPFTVTAFWNETQRPEDFTITATGERTIAGRRAKCFVLEPGPSAGSTGDHELCLSKDGLLLFGHATRGGPASPLSLTAVELSSDAPDAVFEPPYDVTGESEICQDERMEC